MAIIFSNAENSAKARLFVGLFFFKASRWGKFYEYTILLFINLILVFLSADFLTFFQKHSKKINVLLT